MKTKALVSKVGGYFCKAGFQLKQYSPEILVVAGVVGTVVSAVMACKATTKVGAIMEKAKEDIEQIHNCSENQTLVESGKYNKEDARKDLVIVYAQTGFKFVKLYAPSVMLGLLSISGILASNNILRKRNVALAAAYSAVDRGFKEYRNRVIERFGQEVDRELQNNIKARKIEETVVDDNGKTKTVKKNIGVADRNALGPYSFIYDESSRCWEKSGDYNRMFLNAQQAAANDKLRSKGYLFLNEVLDELDIPRTEEQIAMGQAVGWCYDPVNPTKTGDGYVEFGVYESYFQDEIIHKKDKATGEPVGSEVYSRYPILEFNVDGNIYELMKNRKG
jgi:hypothetical protein